jgi:hypothetical protein
MRVLARSVSRPLLAVGVLGLILHAPPAAHAGPNSGPSMLTTAANASLPAAQTNLGLPIIVKVAGNGVTDDWAAIQSAIDSAVAPATIAIPSKPNGIRISQALRLRDNITLWSLDWNQPWICDGSAGGALGQYPFYGCLLFGSYTALNLNQLTPIAVNDPALGATTLSFTSGNYTILNPVVGDIIVVGASSTFSIGGLYNVPQTGQMVRITAVNPGANQVTIATPVEVATTGTRVYKLTNTGLTAINAAGQDTGVPMWSSWKAGVIGGSWTTTIPDAPFGLGSCLECSQKVKSVTAGFGLGYGSLWAGAVGEVENEHIKDVPIELGWSSHGSNFKIGRAEMTGSGASNWLAGIGEASRGNSIDIGFANLGARTPGSIAAIISARRNRLHVGNVVGISTSSHGMLIRASDYQGSPPTTSDNFLQIDADNVGAMTRYVSIEGIYQGATATVGGTLTGYTNGDVVTQGTTGGSCSSAPTWTLTVSAGTVTAATIANAGKCGSPPSAAQSVSGGSGTGLTLNVTYAGSTAVNNRVGYGVHHGTPSGSAFALFGVGAGNWIEGWGDNGTVSQDAQSSTSSGFRNLRDANGHYVNSQTPLVSGLGIGTTVPGAPLDFAGTTGADKAHWGLSTAGVGLAAGGGAVFWGSSADTTNGALIFKRDSRTNATDMAITATGLIGIGGVAASQPALKSTAGTLKIRKADDSAYAPVQGKLTTDANYSAGATTATGYLTLYDATGTAYKVNACLASSC